MLCPSAAPDWDDARLIGIVGGTPEEPRVDYVTPRAVSAELLALAEPVAPTEVFRFAARCQEGRCGHFRDGRCGVATAAVEHLDPIDAIALPRCGIRTSCRWWHDRGPAACRRCPVVVTDDVMRGGGYAEALRGGP